MEETKKYEKKNLTYIEIKRKIMSIKTIDTRNGKFYLLSVKLYSPYFDLYKNKKTVTQEDWDSIQETKENVLWGYIWVREDLFENVSVQKGDWIVVCGHLNFTIYNGEFKFNISATDIKEVVPKTVYEKPDLGSGTLDDIPF